MTGPDLQNFIDEHSPSYMDREAFFEYLAIIGAETFTAFSQKSGKPITELVNDSAASYGD